MKNKLQNELKKMIAHCAGLLALMCLYFYVPTNHLLQKILFIVFYASAFFAYLIALARLCRVYSLLKKMKRFEPIRNLLSDNQKQ